MDSACSCSSSSQCDSAMCCDASFREDDVVLHKVSRTDTIAGLALRYNVNIDDLKRANGLNTDFAMFAKDFLVIPGKQSGSGGSGSPYDRWWNNKYMPPKQTQGSAVSDMWHYDSAEVIVQTPRSPKRKNSDALGDIELIVTKHSASSQD